MTHNIRAAEKCRAMIVKKKVTGACTHPLLTRRRYTNDQVTNRVQAIGKRS